MRNQLKAEGTKKIPPIGFNNNNINLIKRKKLQKKPS